MKLRPQAVKKQVKSSAMQLKKTLLIFLFIPVDLTTLGGGPLLVSYQGEEEEEEEEEK